MEPRLNLKEALTEARRVIADTGLIKLVNGKMAPALPNSADSRRLADAYNRIAELHVRLSPSDNVKAEVLVKL